MSRLGLEEAKAVDVGEGCSYTFSFGLSSSHRSSLPSFLRTDAEEQQDSSVSTSLTKDNAAAVYVRIDRDVVQFSVNASGVWLAFASTPRLLFCEPYWLLCLFRRTFISADTSLSQSRHQYARPLFVFLSQFSSCSVVVTVVGMFLGCALLETCGESCWYYTCCKCFFFFYRWIFVLIFWHDA